MAGIHLLLVIVSLPAGAASEGIVTTVFTNGSCQDGFLSQRDTIFYESYLHLGYVKRGDFKDKAEVFLGPMDHPLYTRLCNIDIRRGHCNYRNRRRDGCWCEDQPESSRKYLVKGYIDATPRMDGQVVTIRWRAQSYRGDLLGSSKEIKVYAVPKASIVVNGDVFNITENMECPSLPLTRSTLFYFCVENAEDPQLTIWFDSQSHCTFDARCGFMQMEFHESYANKQFWFAYTDACRRTSNFTCEIPPDCCESSSLQVMKAMLAVVAVGYLLKSN